MLESSAAVHTVLDAAAQGQNQPPAWLASSGYHFAVARRCWRALCMGRVYRRSENWLWLAAGEGLRMLPGAQNNIVLTGAVVAAVIARATESVELYGQVRQRAKDVAKAWRGYEVLPPVTAWQKAPSKQWLSPSTEQRWRQVAWHQRDYWQRMAKRCYQLACPMLGLVNAIAEMADALSWEPEANSRNVREIFINIDGAIERLAANGPTLVDTLKEQRSTVAAVLQAVGSPCQPDTFIEKVAEATGAAEAFVDYMGPLKKRFGAGVAECAKKGVLGAAAGLGYLEHVPKSFMPEHSSAMRKGGCQLPYPPRESVCRLSYLLAAKQAQASSALQVQTSAVQKPPCLFDAIHMKHLPTVHWSKEPKPFFAGLSSIFSKVFT